MAPMPMIKSHKGPSCQWLKAIKGPHNSDKAIMQHNVMINAKTSIVDYRIIEPNMYNTYILYNIF